MRSPGWIYDRDMRRAMVYDQQAHGLVRFDDPDPNESLLAQIAEVLGLAGAEHGFAAE